MKWSELVKILNDNIKEHGDKSVKYCEIITDDDKELTEIDYKSEN